jgi:transcription elongation factor Elf1
MIHKVMRLNHAVRCEGCNLKGNPYVIERRDTKYVVECPTCAERFEILVADFPDYESNNS